MARPKQTKPTTEDVPTEDVSTTAPVTNHTALTDAVQALTEKLRLAEVHHAHTLGAARREFVKAANDALKAVEYAVSKGRINRGSQMDKAFDGLREIVARASKPTE